MKAKDIVIGQEYAVGSEHYPERAVALEVGPISRRVYSGTRWDFGGHNSTTPACRVRVLQRKTGLPGQQETVYALTKILRPWAEQEARDEAAKQRRIREAEAAQALRAKADALQDALETAGVSCFVWSNEGKVTVTLKGGGAVDALHALVTP